MSPTWSLRCRSPGARPDRPSSVPGSFPEPPPGFLLLVRFEMARLDATKGSRPACDPSHPGRPAHEGVPVNVLPALHLHRDKSFLPEGLKADAAEAHNSDLGGKATTKQVTNAVCEALGFANA
jgi:hypothetical protein